MISETSYAFLVLLQFRGWRGFMAAQPTRFFSSPVRFKPWSSRAWPTSNRTWGVAMSIMIYESGTEVKLNWIGLGKELYIIEPRHSLIGLLL